MKKWTAVLFALILLVLVAMQLPWAYLTSYASFSKDGAHLIIYHPQAFEYSNFAIGNTYTAFSCFLALLALLFAPFSGKRSWCRYLCGFLLLCSAAAGLYDGFFNDFKCFTPLTWCILAALTGLGLWAIFAFRKKPQAQSAEASAETAN